MELLGDVGQVEHHSIRFEIVLISAQDKCMVCAKCIIGLEIFLATPDGPPRWRGQIEAHFGTFGDIVNLSARLVHSLG
jgi:hypothetical protein